ncbi:MAG: Permease of the major facilitator superfamily [Acidimicrobiaceae bacterium]|nr:Permease of the major facilitator superfamily [Acidimicrobiaceae bacterium]
MSRPDPLARGVGGFSAGAAGAYLLVGLPDGMLGVAWPSIRANLHLPLDALGVLLLASTAGYLTTSATSGAMLRRFGIIAVLCAATLVQAGGAAGLAAAPALLVLVAGSALLGIAGGAIDAGLSSAVSLGARPSFLNLLHAVYGVGAAVAPLAVLLAVHLASWRLAYVALAGAQGALALVWASHLRRGQVFAGLAHADSEPLRKNGILALSMGAFFLAAGLEFATASWAASYLDSRLGKGSILVGVGVVAYWVTLAGSRFGAASAPSRWGPAMLAPAGAALAAAGAALVWSLPAAGAIAGFALLGFGIGPIYPALALLTPERVGRGAAPSAMGWQLAAGSLGSSACSAVAGVVLQQVGLGATGPILLVLALSCAAVLLVLHRMAPVAPALVGEPV